MGGMMATPNTLEEESHLYDLGGGGFWIDCNDIQEEGTWECKDGATDVDFRNWVDGQPEGGAAWNCGFLWATGWYDYPCDASYPAVCKKSVA
ncbi:tetranectin-like [Asterias amurensis]|uniref:tetranectin-like n=1 Tax=Asterias amurensis TaxID=7602 RepID=UPI003AB61AEE